MTAEKRVLVVDDDEPIRKLLSIVLKRRGVTSDHAIDGVDGLAKLGRCRYSLVLLDLMMPRMSGYEMLENLANVAPELRPTVVVLTAGPRPQLRPDLVLTLIRKPFDVDVVADVVIAALETSPPMLQPDGCPDADSERLLSRADEPSPSSRTN